MGKEQPLSVEQDRLLAHPARLIEFIDDTESIESDKRLLEAEKAVLRCGCQQCQFQASELRNRLYPPQPNPLGVEPPSWSMAANAILKNSRK